MTDELPAGTVTLLLADVEGSTRLWETETAQEMAAALSRMETIVEDAAVRHGGRRPVEQGEGDSFVVAFARASDAVSCALELQRADLGVLRLRLGLHAGEVDLRDDGNYMGEEMNRAARLRELAHGGQTVLSSAARDLAVDRLPLGAWLTDLGTHRLRDLTRPEHVHQLCAPDVRTDFPPLRSLDTFAHNLPVQLTTFIGRAQEMDNVRSFLAENRLVTLTGAGGAGKTRLAVHVGGELIGDHPGGVWHVDLSGLADPSLVDTAAARAMGLQDEVGRTAAETIARHIGSGRVLLLLDNCEHLVAGCAALVETLLRGCTGLVVLATSREPLGVGGEVAFRLPSLSTDGEAADAVELFVDRARRARPGFTMTTANAAAVTEICRRLDGIPLAIELASARIRALSVEEIVAGLHDRFALLTGGTRTAVPRQQTLRASVDWSHDLLTDPERILFRRLSVFAGGFDLGAARAVAAGDGLQPHQVLDELALLVDKSLVLADEVGELTRYRMLETVRAYAHERLADADEEADVRRRHRDHYLRRSSAPLADLAEDEQVDQLALDLDNLRAAFRWSLDIGESARAQALASRLTRLWIRGRFIEGSTWLDESIESDVERAPMSRGWALTCSALLAGYLVSVDATARADEAVVLARELANPTLLAAALHGAGNAYGVWAHAAGEAFYREGLDVATVAGLEFERAQMLDGLGALRSIIGDQRGAQGFFEEARRTLESVGATGTFLDRQDLTFLAQVHMLQGDLLGGLALVDEVLGLPNLDGSQRSYALCVKGWTLALMGHPDEARSAASESDALGREVAAGFNLSIAGIGFGYVELAAGDAHAACERLLEVAEWMAGAEAAVAPMYAVPLGLAELAVGDVAAARRRADLAARGVAATSGPWTRGRVLALQARVALAEGDATAAQALAQDALAGHRDGGDKLSVCDSLELLAGAIASEGRYDVAARLLGAAESIRTSVGYARFVVDQPSWDATLASCRDSLDAEALATAWRDGAALSIDDIVAFATRGRGPRRRPTTGWGSLTPTESEVAELVAEGLSNRDIAQRLFVSPRTIQTHLTHIYAKLQIDSRVKLATSARDLHREGGTSPAPRSYTSNQ